MLAKTRAFFQERAVLEADTPILSTSAPVEAHIDVMRVEMGRGKIGYLHTSPEYGLKKLLAKGSGDIYQLGHVFRQDEEGPLHMPEFTMIEWYRVGMPYEKFIDETLDLILLFLGELPSETLTYREAFLKYVHINYTNGALTSHLRPLSPDAIHWDLDTQLNLLFSHLIEPKLGQNQLTVITDYPPSQAALAKTALVEGEQVAKRFEIYFNGIELGNGFDELTDAKEQRIRLDVENQKRINLGKEALPIDEEFLTALETLPDCCGVAVGFDRLMALMNLSK
ncbi:MAG: Elongation factor P--(R)-beta-lysine ligase [Chlamydiae bacterium]|nr:Elongation factor P--(R)-beta-lysine ligase [Chlamydiota bacterium]